MWHSARMLPPDPERARTLFATALTRRPWPDAPWRHLLVVDVPRQRAVLFDRGGGALAEYVVSTAAAGIGGADGSQRTPPGLHRVHARIGAGRPPGAVFASREPTGEVWRGEARPDDLILTRVLTLEGLEDGVNRGPGCDSLERYIYLHGTNHEAALGEPASHGCVRLANADVDRALRPRAPRATSWSCCPRCPSPTGGPGRFHYAGLAAAAA